MSYYSEHAKEYIESTIGADMSEAYSMFEPRLPKGGIVLDVGFGSARDMLHFRNAGFEVHGIDVEESFVDHAKSLGLDAEVGDVLTYETEKRFDGIWACASLLHLRANQLHAAIDKLLYILKDRGVLFISMKEGDSEYVDEKGRPMLLVGEDAFAGYKVEATKKTLEEGRGITWINVVIRK